MGKNEVKDDPVEVFERAYKSMLF